MEQNNVKNLKEKKKKTLKERGNELLRHDGLGVLVALSGFMVLSNVQAGNWALLSILGFVVLEKLRMDREAKGGKSV